MPGLTANDWKGLWAILWRTLVFGPVVWVVGTILLAVIIGAIVAPPAYAVFAFLAGDWLLGTAVLLPWFVLLRFRQRIFRWAFAGIEYGGI